MNTIQELRREFKAYGKIEFCYDVYCDRVNFYGFSNEHIYRHFFEVVRATTIVCDRSGWSISREDAEMLGIPTEKDQYIIDCRDLRRKIAA